MKWMRWLLRWLRRSEDRAEDVRKEETMCHEPYDPQSLLERVKRALVEMEWKFGEDAERNTLLTGYGGRHGTSLCVVQVHPTCPLIAVYTHVQCRVPEEKRATMMEYLTRANYGLWMGNFELDLRDGEIRYKTDLHLADGELTAEMLAAQLRINGDTLDRYLPGIMSVLWNDVSAEDAIGLTEAA
jgi:hypothetical protein